MQALPQPASILIILIVRAKKNSAQPAFLFSSNNDSHGKIRLVDNKYILYFDVPSPSDDLS